MDQRVVEVARERDQHRRRLIPDGRRLVADFNSQVRASTLFGYMNYQPEFPAIRAHLSPEFLKELQDGRLLVVSDGVKDGRVYGFMQELDRMEKEWGLS